jgi:DNA polymerase-1
MEMGGNIPWTKLSNYPVQGTCADIMTVGRITLFNRLRKLNLETKLVSTVHDSIVLDAPNHEVDIVAKTAVESFDDIPKNFKKLWGITLPIPFPGEVKVGPNLKDLNKL